MLLHCVSLGVRVFEALLLLLLQCRLYQAGKNNSCREGRGKGHACTAPAHGARKSSVAPGHAAH